MSVLAWTIWFVATTLFVVGILTFGVFAAADKVPHLRMGTPGFGSAGRVRRNLAGPRLHRTHHLHWPHGAH